MFKYLNRVLRRKLGVDGLVLELSWIKIRFSTVLIAVSISGLNACAMLPPTPSVVLTEGYDHSAGENVPAYIITTANATYYLEREGGGLSSMLDKDGIDWIGFNNIKGSGWKGEYRGFPNAVHKQDGSYFHAMNASTAPSRGEVIVNKPDHVQIHFISSNGKWKAQWDFYPDRCDFTMLNVSDGYHYWVQYEGVPGGEMDSSDFWYSSNSNTRQSINTPFDGDLPSPEWITFGDKKLNRVIYLYSHEDDDLPDTYASRPYMTVFGFGRKGKEKYLNAPQKFTIGFLESNDYAEISHAMRLKMAP